MRMDGYGMLGAGGIAGSSVQEELQDPRCKMFTAPDSPRVGKIEDLRLAGLGVNSLVPSL